MSFKVSGLILPINKLLDKYPITDSLYGIDGLRCVPSLNDMYNIPLERRRSGMVVGVYDNLSNDTTYYKLIPGVSWSVGTLSVSDWDPFLPFGTASGLSIKYNIENETIVVPADHQYLLYGNLNIGTGGDFQNFGQTVLINGTIVLTGDGTYSVGGAGSIQEVSLSQTSKYSATFSAGAGSSTTINHSLNSSDILLTVRDGNNFVYPNIEILDSNNIKLTTTGTISNGRINILI